MLPINALVLIEAVAPGWSATRNLSSTKLLSPGKSPYLRSGFGRDSSARLARISGMQPISRDAPHRFEGKLYAFAWQPFSGYTFVRFSMSNTTGLS